jgi:hypothetical protein
MAAKKFNLMRGLILQLKKTVGCLALMLLAWSVQAQDYDFFYKSAWLEAHFQGDSLYITKYVYEHGAEPTATPAGVRLQRSTKWLTEEDKQSLQDCLLTSGFLELPEDAYGVEASQRFYPYTIQVQWEERGKDKGGVRFRTKKVVYRSSPLAEPPPAAFSTLQECLLKIVNARD